jgi:ATP-dependent Clp protease ATP-binding subunit ClpA
LEKRIEELRQQKMKVLSEQKIRVWPVILFAIRKNSASITGRRHQRWEQESQQHPEISMKNRFAEVVAHDVGIPVNVLHQAEGLKLRQMKD